MNRKLNCFVAIPYSEPDNKRYYDIYEDAIKKGGAVPCRADENMYRADIPTQILQMIKKADMLFVDASSDRPAVLIEIGYAMCLKLPIIRVRHKDSKRDLSVYERNEMTLLYTNESRSDFDALELKIIAAIQKTVNELSNKIIAPIKRTTARPRDNNPPFPKVSHPYVPQNWRKHLQEHERNERMICEMYKPSITEAFSHLDLLKTAEHLQEHERYERMISKMSTPAMIKAFSTPHILKTAEIAAKMPRLYDFNIGAIEAIQKLRTPLRNINSRHLRDKNDE